MKVLVAGATGAIGNAILQRVLHRNDIDRVIALTRKAISDTAAPNPKLQNIVIQDFGQLDQISDETWSQISDADAIIWAVGTYTLNEDVNLKYPLAFQEALQQRRQQLHAAQREGGGDTRNKFKFILLSGAFVEPDQSRTLFFLSGQRKMKGVLQTKTLEFAQSHVDTWEAIIIRPGGVLFDGNPIRNKFAELVGGKGLAIRSDELAACVADLVVNGSPQPVVENPAMVEKGREVLREAVSG